MAAIEDIRAGGALPKTVEKALSDIVTSVSCYNFNAGFVGYENAAFLSALDVFKELGTPAARALVIATPKRMENVQL